MKRRYQIELDGFPTETVVATDQEKAWDIYKEKYPQARRRYHNRTPKVTDLGLDTFDDGGANE